MFPEREEMKVDFPTRLGPMTEMMLNGLSPTFSAILWRERDIVLELCFVFSVVGGGGGYFFTISHRRD